MSKIIPAILVHNCWECPHSGENPEWMHYRYYCSVDKKCRSCRSKKKFPVWCPLDDAPKEEGDDQK